MWLLWEILGLHIKAIHKSKAKRNVTFVKVNFHLANHLKYTLKQITWIREYLNVKLVTRHSLKRQYKNQSFHEKFHQFNEKSKFFTNQIASKLSAKFSLWGIPPSSVYIGRTSSKSFTKPDLSNFRFGIQVQS